MNRPASMRQRPWVVIGLSAVLVACTSPAVGPHRSVSEEAARREQPAGGERRATERADAQPPRSRIERFAALHAALVPLVDRARALPPPPPRGRWLAELSGEYPEVVATYGPLQVERPQDLHAIFDALMARLALLDPTVALNLGVHPHPTELKFVPDEDLLRMLLLCRDAGLALEAVDLAGASAHERTDQVLLRSMVDVALRSEPGDNDILATIEGWLQGGVVLEQIACCPEEDRRAAVLGQWRSLPARLAEAREALKDFRPARAQVERLVRRVTDVHDHLGGPDADRGAELDSALRAARSALAAFAGVLRLEVLPTADGQLGTGPANVALLLEHHHHLAGGPAGVLEGVLQDLGRAVDAFARADQLLATAPDEVDTDASMPELETLLGQLADRVPEWVEGGAPDDPGLELGPIPALWRGLGTNAFYVPPGPLAPNVRGRVMRDDAPWYGDSTFRRKLASSLYHRHLVAHETYPGHHLQALLARAHACLLRQLYGDRLLMEGWARRAEGLIHDRCPRVPTHDWLLADQHLIVTSLAALDLVIQLRLADEEQLLEWLRLIWDVEPTLAELGALAESPLLLASYHLGERELERLPRPGGWTDARFHAAILRAGPIPIPLIGRELLGR